MENIVINLGSSDLQRISCANHKLNLVVRHAISNHKLLEIYMTKLNKFIDKIRSVLN